MRAKRGFSTTGLIFEGGGVGILFWPRERGSLLFREEDEGVVGMEGESFFSREGENFVARDEEVVFDVVGDVFFCPTPPLSNPKRESGFTLGFLVGGGVVSSSFFERGEIDDDDDEEEDGCCVSKTEEEEVLLPPPSPLINAGNFLFLPEVGVGVVVVVGVSSSAINDEGSFFFEEEEEEVGEIVVEFPVNFDENCFSLLVVD
mmetsp:Transcript_10803/g.14456  ORF Transcript_10803/g.14456 Transcript_10803/m.14456 type:complete len:203 (-) Transcript_10803:452-1060(-)